MQPRPGARLLRRMNLIFRAFLFTQASFLVLSVLWVILNGATSLPGLAQELSTYYNGVNLRLATTNGTTLFFILLFGLSGDKRYVLGILIFFGIFIWLRPTLRRVQRELQLSEAQVDDLF